MPASGFHVRIILRGQEEFDRLRDKLDSFARVFDAIIDRWMVHNEAKFELAQGAQAAGVTFPGTDVFWKPLSELYMARKAKAGYDDWLMVRDGDLINSLTDRNAPGFYEEITDMSARFGTLLKQALYNEQTRPVMFLDTDDQAMIRDMFVAHLEDGPPFASWSPPPGRTLDLEFAGIMAGS